MALPLTLLITGTGTDVGKTVLATLLVRRLVQLGHPVHAFKPVCSGGRSDAQALWRAQRRQMPLSVVNPWWFETATTPREAARAAGVSLQLAEVCAHLRRHACRTGVTLVEGGGGLLSPLGDDFDSRRLLTALDAAPLVVTVNRLGVLNEAWLTLEALPRSARARARWVLFDPVQPDASSASNPLLLGERIGADRIHPLPRCTAHQLLRPHADLLARLDRLILELGIPPR